MGETLEQAVHQNTHTEQDAIGQSNAGATATAQPAVGQEADDLPGLADAAVDLSPSDCDGVEPDGPQDAATTPAAASPLVTVGPDLIVPELWQLVHGRMAIVMKLQTLAMERDALAKTPDLPAEVTSELSRQDRETKRYPTAEMAKQTLAATQARIAQMCQLASQGQAPAPAQSYLEAIELAKRQWALFIEREELAPKLLSTAAQLAADQPLFQLLQPTSCPPQTMYGWAVYAVVLEVTKRQATLQKEKLQQALAGGDNSKDPAATQGQLDRLELVLAAATRERNAIEAPMSEAFWQVYTEGAALLASGNLDKTAERHVRALLRYGMIGGAPWFLPEPLAIQLLQDCTQSAKQFDTSVYATHVFYADEYLHLVARGQITPSVDEDLELNEQGSPRWKQDRAWRRLISARNHEAALDQVLKETESHIQAIQQKNAQLEQELTGLGRDAASQQTKVRLRETLQANRVELARRTIAADRLRNQLLPDQKARADDSTSKLTGAGGNPDPQALARQEAQRLHRVCLLCNKLKDPFPPFALRDNYKPESGAVNDRQSVLVQLQEAEKRDPTIFKEIAVHNKKASQRTYIRYCPYAILTPTCGFMSFAWNPRDNAEVGRLVIPGYCPRPGTLESLVYTVSADFRWDTSKESAGMDVLTSDTLVAAYCTVRWDYRKRSKETREKAGIHTEESDRKNWRRHYLLYMDSAMEGGKKLFFKCGEIYAAVVKYMGLPEGVQKLQR